MQAPLEIQKTVIAKVDSYLQELERAIAGTSDVKAKIDIGFHLDRIAKRLGSTSKAIKDSLEFKNRKEIFGENAKAKLSVSTQYEYPVADIQSELAPDDFLRVVKVEAKKLPTFLPDARIAELRQPVKEIRKVTFENLK